jgi:hypothetical protein
MKMAESRLEIDRINREYLEHQEDHRREYRLRMGIEPCPDRIEVPLDASYIPAATIKAWVDHLRTHKIQIDPKWIERARHGFYR